MAARSGPFFHIEGRRTSWPPAPRRALGDARIWVPRAQVDAGERPRLTTEESERLRQLERENKELRGANEILKSASAFSAAELDGRRPIA